MKGKTIVITGGTSGIGQVAAETLARMGARIILVARSKSRAEATLARLRRSGPGAAHSVYFADLTSLAEMKRVAAEIANREPPIDVLINNAGALFGTRRLTEDGLEHTFALNHMSYFVVTEGLRERLLASGAARIINTASAAHQGATLDFDDLRSAKSFNPMRAYSRSKLCNILFTRELARRLHGTGVTANCLHPGFVATGFADESDGLVSHLAWLAKFFAISRAEGAQTIIYLASSSSTASCCSAILQEQVIVIAAAPAHIALDQRDSGGAVQVRSKGQTNARSRRLKAHASDPRCEAS